MVDMEEVGLAETDTNSGMGVVPNTGRGPALVGGGLQPSLAFVPLSELHPVGHGVHVSLPCVPL